MNSPKTDIKVLIVDDSMVVRKLLVHIIEQDAALRVIGEARDGAEAIALVQRLQPDIVSMDIQMPGMNGVEVTRYLMQHHPLPIVVASSYYQPTDQAAVLEVLAAGAVGIVMKPTGPGHPEHEQTTKKYLTMIRSLAEVKVVRRRIAHQTDTGKTAARPSISSASIQPDAEARVMVVGASAGGPDALVRFFQSLTRAVPVPILLVQHIDASFAEGFGHWLEVNTAIKVVMCDKHQDLLPNVVYLAPPGYHMLIEKPARATLSQLPPEGGHRPSVGMLFRSAAMHYGATAIGVLLSGMGSDGARDLLAMRNAGGLTYAQNKESCLVFGMPGEAVKIGAAKLVDTPANIAKHINNHFLNTSKLP